MKFLSEKRIRLLRLLGRYQREDRFPLVRELAQELGLRSQTSLDAMLVALERDNYIVKYGGGPERRQRVYRLAPKGVAVVPESVQHLTIPVLGEIPAGPVAEAIQHSADFVDPGNSLAVRPGDFFLTVKGNSMIGDGILPQDRVLLRPGVKAANGEIAAVQINQHNGSYDATLKHVHYQPGKKTIRLRASNPAYADMMVSARDVEIVGVYRGLIRSQ